MIPLSQFAYALPLDLIAQYPLKSRDHSRLMVVHRQHKTITHDTFSNLSRYLPQKSYLILNESKVIPARLLGERTTGGRVQIFLLNKRGDGTYHALVSPLGKLKENEWITFKNSSLKAQVFDKENRWVRFNKKDISKDLEAIGHVPLPPYIKRPDEKLDHKQYQTVFAKKLGSIAAPTAGLHFTPQLLSKLKKQGHTVDKITLHISYATFKPVKAEDITQHKMHAESYEISSVTWRKIQQAKKAKRTIVCVGTTSCRVLETIVRRGILKGQTDIFIYPGYSFQAADALITNFHLPFSTLLMMVYAFGGMELIKCAYEEAIKMKYRFFSYGDAMLIL